MTTTTHPDPDPGAATRRALLDQARGLFAREGYDAASVRAITQAADANLGAITYHFGGKHGLYLEVLREVMEPLRTRIVEVIEGPGSHLDRATEVVRRFFEHFLEFPEMPPLILQRIATGSPPPSPVLNTMRRSLGGLARLIEEGQKAGGIRDGDPVLLALSLVSQPVYMTLVTPVLQVAAGRSFEAPAEREALVEHAAGFARAALARRDEGTS